MSDDKRCCKMCEYFDAEGRNPYFIPDDYTGDCLNPYGARFTPRADDQYPRCFAFNSSLAHWKDHAASRRH